MFVSQAPEEFSSCLSWPLVMVLAVVQKQTTRCLIIQSEISRPTRMAPLAGLGIVPRVCGLIRVRIPASAINKGR